MTSGEPPWRRWPSKRQVQRAGADDVPELSPDEVERRVEGRDGSVHDEPPEYGGWIGDPPASGEPAEPPVDPDPGASATLDSGREIALTAVTRESGSTMSRRRLLWRDSATILIFAVLALLVAQALPAGDAGGPASSTTTPSGVVVGSLPPGFSLPPGVTFGPIVDPSLGIDATPTPIPAATQVPTPTPGPNSTPAPSPKPTAKPTKTPPPTPPPTSPPTPPPTPIDTPAPPPPSVTLSCSVVSGWNITCSASEANTQPGSETWTFGGTGTRNSGGDGFSTLDFTYDADGTYTIIVQVTGDDGSTTSGQDSVTVAGP